MLLPSNLLFSYRFFSPVIYFLLLHLLLYILLKNQHHVSLFLSLGIRPLLHNNQQHLSTPKRFMHSPSLPYHMRLHSQFKFSSLFISFKAFSTFFLLSHSSLLLYLPIPLKSIFNYFLNWVKVSKNSPHSQFPFHHHPQFLILAMSTFFLILSVLFIKFLFSFVYFSKMSAHFFVKFLWSSCTTFLAHFFIPYMLPLSLVFWPETTF